MEIKRERTLFFSFKKVDFVPLEIEIHRWFMKLGIIDDQLTVIDLHYHTKNVVAKFKNQNQFESFFKRHSQGIPFEKHGKIHIIPIFMPGSPWKKIQIKYVPDEMDTNLFKKVLEPYGKIKKVEYEIPALNLLKTKREKLTIEMIVTKNIPSFITVMDNRFAVSYPGQIKTCARCDSENHEARHCDTGRKSYSQAVEGSPAIALAIDTLQEIVNEAERGVVKKHFEEESETENISETSESEIEEKRRKKKRERKKSEDSDKIKKDDKLKRLKKRIKPNVKAARVYQGEQENGNIAAIFLPHEEKVISPTETEMNNDWPVSTTKELSKTEKEIAEIVPDRRSSEKIRITQLTSEREVSLEGEEEQEFYSDIPPDIEGEERDPSNQNTNFTPIL